MQELGIDPEFRDKIPPLTEAEYEQLKENILTAGEVYEPIVVWNGTIIDGHNRWRVVQGNPGISYRVRAMDFPDKWAAFEWMYKNQLGRRNLTEQQREMLIGQMYEAAKKRVGEHKGNQYTKVESDQNDRFPNSGGDTSERVAQQLGIGPASVRRAAKFKSGIDAMNGMGEDGKSAASKILSGEADVSKKAVRTFSKMNPEQQERVVRNINEGKPADPPKQEPKREEPPKKPLSQKEQIRAAIASLKGQGPDKPAESEAERFLRSLKANAGHALAIIRSEIEQNRGVLTEQCTKDETKAIINAVIDNLRDMKADL